METFRDKRVKARKEHICDFCEKKIAKGEEIQKDCLGFDEKLVIQVSNALGHNRTSVVIYHYFR